MTAQDDLAAQIADLQQRVMALEAAEHARRCSDPFAGQEASAREAATQVPSPAPPEPSPVEAAWHAAPLALRLAFVADLLGPEHTLHAALKEAGRIEEMRSGGEELPAWVSGYPALFVDAIARLRAAVACSPVEPVELLGAETLRQALTAVDASLEAAGVQWIEPPAGAAITGEHEVVDSEPSEAREGAVARMCRPGLRKRGRLLLPAQVTRAARRTGALQEDAAPPTNDLSTELGPLQHSASSPQPAWMLALKRRCEPSDDHRAQQTFALLEALVAAAPGSDDALTAALEPVLALFGPRPPELPEEWLAAFDAHRDDVTGWLRDSADVELVQPAVGERFDPATMEVAGIRRTAHPHEAGAVARIERPGAVRRGARLLPARVVRYELGDGL